MKVNRHLQRVFGNQLNLEKAVKDLKVDKNGNVTVDELKHFVLSQCKDEMITKRLNKKDIEGFLSAFIYNAYGATSISTIPYLVFTDENYVAKNL